MYPVAPAIAMHVGEGRSDTASFRETIRRKAKTFPLDLEFNFPGKALPQWPERSQEMEEGTEGGKARHKVMARSLEGGLVPIVFNEQIDIKRGQRQLHLWSVF